MGGLLALCLQRAEARFQVTLKSSKGDAEYQVYENDQFIKTVKKPFLGSWVCSAHVECADTLPYREIDEDEWKGMSKTDDIVAMHEHGNEKWYLKLSKKHFVSAKGGKPRFYRKSTSKSNSDLPGLDAIEESSKEDVKALRRRLIQRLHRD